jgi:hypothetical protein
MKKIIILSLITISLLTILSFVMMSSCYAKGNKEIKTANSDGVDYVPNEETAVRVAEAILYPIYGENVYQQRPFIAILENEIWVIEGSLPEGMKGGVAYIEIRKKDCKVLKVSHGK